MKKVNRCGMQIAMLIAATSYLCPLQGWAGSTLTSGALRAPTYYDIQCKDGASTTCFSNPYDSGNNRYWLCDALCGANNPDPAAHHEGCHGFLVPNTMTYLVTKEKKVSTPRQFHHVKDANKLVGEKACKLL